jgi:hypothetical protein
MGFGDKISNSNVSWVFDKTFSQKVFGQAVFLKGFQSRLWDLGIRFQTQTFLGFSIKPFLKRFSVK